MNASSMTSGVLIPTTNPRIVFIGAGNMATALISGLLATGTAAEQIIVSSPRMGSDHPIEKQFAVQTTTNNQFAASQADVLVLAVKPQIVAAVAPVLAETMQQRKPLIISIAAGVQTQTLAKWFGKASMIVRSMPNLPVKLRHGMTGLYTHSATPAAYRQLAASLFEAVGQILWVPHEKQLDAVTAVSGSGPAYFFLILEAMEQAAQQLGLDQAAARQLTTQTILGTAHMVTEQDQTGSPAGLRQQVTSPGGTTAAALQVLEQRGLRDIFTQALVAARDRSEALAQ